MSPASQGALARVLACALVHAAALGSLPVRADAPEPTTPAPEALEAPALADVSALSNSDSQEYRGLVDEALKEYGLGHYEEARTLFMRAHAIQPSARTHRGIGLAEYELRNYPECIAQLEAALASNERPLSGQVRAATEDVLKRAARYVARVHIALQPSGARLAVDHVPVTLLPQQPLVLRVGEHLVEARADGYVPAARTLTVLGGADMNLELTLSPVARAPESEAPRVAPAPPVLLAVPHDAHARRWYTSPWLWAAVGVAVAGAAVAVGFAAKGGGEKTGAPYGGSTGQTADGP